MIIYLVDRFIRWFFNLFKPKIQIKIIIGPITEKTKGGEISVDSNRRTKGVFGSEVCN
jgi:hypothetical protein